MVMTSAAPAVSLQGRNSVASINSGYNNDQGAGGLQNRASQARAGDTGSEYRHLNTTTAVAGNQQQFVILENDHYYDNSRRTAANLQS